ncbi:hypothetical protein JCM10908_000168 [Rhodotorula pacifica]|uniref:uncharacterized protein n=1 Tax=Rhodotorula pacifica TaxID=1495444 RepID=UPI00316E0DE6
MSNNDARPPPLTLQVGSRWSAYDEYDLVRITIMKQALEEGFPTRDIPVRGRGWGKSLVFECGYDKLASKATPCTFRVRLDPDSYALFPCTIVQEACLEHNHPHDLPRVLWLARKATEQADLNHRIRAVANRAIDRMTVLKRALDFKKISPDPLTEWDLNKSVDEQDLIVQSWALLPDGEVRDKLHAKTKVDLIAPADYPTEPVDRDSPEQHFPTPVRSSRAPTPDTEQKAKRQTSTESSEEDTPVRKRTRRHRDSSGNEVAADDTSPSPVRNVRLSSARARSKSPKLEDLSEPPTYRSSTCAAPPSASSPNRNKLAKFLSALEPDRNFEQYLHLFGRSNLNVIHPRQLLSFARGPAEELDGLLFELGREVDGIKGMPTLWQRIFRRLLLAAAERDQNE